jgi:uncharacterized membrane protein YgdD (TMEM256/DUF423 family)
MKPSRLFAIALFWFAIAIILGAFAAHGLKGKLDEKALSWWLTAVEYHRINALGIGLYASWMQTQVLQTQVLQTQVLQTQAKSDEAHIKQMSIFFHIGLILFSGSLYAMALGGPRILGAITPIGGATWILSWLYGAYVSFRRQ